MPDILSHNHHFFVFSLQTLRLCVRNNKLTGFADNFRQNTREIISMDS